MSGLSAAAGAAAGGLGAGRLRAAAGGPGVAVGGPGVAVGGPGVAVCRRGAAGGVRLLVIVGATLTAGATPAIAAKPPRIDAKSAIVVEASTGQIAYALRPNERRPIASTTKLMTALLTLERGGLDDIFTAPPYAADPIESKLGLQTGERMTARDLLRALLLVSANDGAADLATGVSGSIPAFVEAMNARARALGLRDTAYANPVGLDDPDNYSTAADLVKLAIVLRRNRFFRETTDLERTRLRSGVRPRTIVNRNELLAQSPEVDGVKTGYTSSAGYVLVGSATHNGVTVVSAVLGEPSKAARNADSLALLRYGLSQFRQATPVRRGARLATTKVKYRNQDTIALVAAAGVRRVVRRGAPVRVAVVGVPGQLEGPLGAGTRAATAVVSVSGRVIARVPVVTALAVPEVGIGERALAFVRKPGSLVVIGALLACLALILLRSRRRRHRATESEPA